MPKPFAVGENNGQVALVGCEKGAMGKQLPLLMDWLCSAAYEDGKPMGMVNLTLKRQGTLMLACLKIQDQGGMKIEVADKDPNRALAALEALLGAEPAPWQRDAYPLGGQSKKR